MGHKALISQLGPVSLVLQWLEGDSFQLTTQGLPVFCGLLGGGIDGEYVYFQRSDSKVVGLTIPGLIYGTYFRKTS